MLDQTADGAMAPPPGRPGQSRTRRRPAPRPATPAGGLQPAAFLPALRRRRWVVVLCMLLLPALAGVAAARLPARYTATGAVLFDPADYAARELQSILREDPATDAVMASQVEIVRGLGTAAVLADRLDLAGRPEFNPALRRPGPAGRLLGGLLGGLLARVRPAPAPVSAQVSAQVSAEAARSRLLLAVQAAIGVEVVRGSRVLEVSFTAGDPRLAARGADLVMQHYIDAQLDAKFAAVRRASDWLEGRVADLRRQVREAEDRIAAYRARAGLFQGVQAGLDTEQISRLTGDLVQARADLANAEGRLDAVRGRSGAAEQAAVAPGVMQLRAQADAVAAQLQATLARVGPNHPDAIGQRRQLAEMQRAVGGEVARVAVAAEGDVRAGRARVAALERSLAAARARVDAGAQAQVPLNAMQRDADAARGLLAAVLERMQQTTQQTAIEKADARVISAALPPLVPSFPRPRAMIGLAAAAGLLLGVTLAYLLELADTTLHSGEDGRRWFGLACFALVPELTRRQLGRLPVADYVAYKPLSPFAEQMRALRAGLFLGGLRPKVVAITAARPAEGKTALAIALGRSAAMAGERVLVLDCDVREPALGRMLGAASAAGLTDLLLGYAALEDVARPDPLTSLRYIPAGSPQADSATLFASPAMVALLRAARPHYDLIVLDAPPALAVTDARLLARLADVTLLAVRWRHTPRRVVAHALELLEEGQAHVCGLALTRVDARVHGRAGHADSDVYHPRYGGYFRE